MNTRKWLNEISQGDIIQIYMGSIFILYYSTQLVNINIYDDI